MKVKKLFAALTAATMVLSPMTAFAAPTTISSGDSTASGSGSVDYVDTSPIYEVTLPTSAILDFEIDPQGLIGLEEGQSSTLEDLDGKGAIVSGAGVIIKNESSVPVEVAVKLHVTDTSDADSKVTLVDTYDGVEADTNTNMLLLAIPGAAKVSGNDAAAASGVGVPITDLDAAPSTGNFTFLLKEAVYKVKNTNDVYTYEKADDVDQNYDAASFTLGGLVNSKANWKAYTGADKKEIGLQAVFTYAAARADAAVDTTKGAYGLESCTTIAVQDGEASRDVLTSDGSTDVVIYYTGTAPTSIKLLPVTTTGSNKGEAVKTVGTDVVAESDRVVLKASWLAGLKASELRGTGTYKISFGTTERIITIN